MAQLSIAKQQLFVLKLSLACLFCLVFGLKRTFNFRGELLWPAFNDFVVSHKHLDVKEFKFFARPVFKLHHLAKDWI